LMNIASALTGEDGMVNCSIAYSWRVP